MIFIFRNLRGRPFDSEGGGGWHFLEINILNLKPPLYFETEYCLFCGRRRVAVARYRMICLVLENAGNK